MISRKSGNHKVATVYLTKIMQIHTTKVLGSKSFCRVRIRPLDYTEIPENHKTIGD